MIIPTPCKKPLSLGCLLHWSLMNCNLIVSIGVLLRRLFHIHRLLNHIEVSYWRVRLPSSVVHVFGRFKTTKSNGTFWYRSVNKYTKAPLKTKGSTILDRLFKTIPGALVFFLFTFLIKFPVATCERTYSVRKFMQTSNTISKSTRYNAF